MRGPTRSIEVLSMCAMFRNSRCFWRFIFLVFLERWNRIQFFWREWSQIFLTCFEYSNKWDLSTSQESPNPHDHYYLYFFIMIRSKLTYKEREHRKGSPSSHTHSLTIDHTTIPSMSHSFIHWFNGLCAKVHYHNHPQNECNNHAHNSRFPFIYVQLLLLVVSQGKILGCPLDD